MENVHFLGQTGYRTPPTLALPPNADRIGFAVEFLPGNPEITLGGPKNDRKILHRQPDCQLQGREGEQPQTAKPGRFRPSCYPGPPIANCSQIASTRFLVFPSISMRSGQGRVKPSSFHLRVASMPIFEP